MFLAKPISLAPSSRTSLLSKEKADVQRVHAVCHIYHRPGSQTPAAGILIIAAYALTGKCCVTG